MPAVAVTVTVTVTVTIMEAALPGPDAVPGSVDFRHG